MVFSSRRFGLKWGAILSLISFLYLSQTSLKGIGIPSISDYVDITIPTDLFGVSLVIIAWILMIGGLVMFLMASFDIKPFDF